MRKDKEKSGQEDEEQGWLESRRGRRKKEGESGKRQAISFE